MRFVCPVCKFEYKIDSFLSAYIEHKQYNPTCQGLIIQREYVEVSKPAARYKGGIAWRRNKRAWR